ncbi:MAG TPA: alpha/beta hydrolase [Longimicrobiaceae bacterium]|nr:alpha/beta hydrolase [Longimicrobiaceae bacterium]
MAIALIVVYAAVTVVMYLAADRLIFQPHAPSPRPAADVVMLRSARGDRIAALWLPNPAARYTILFSHGNGEDVDDDRPFLEALRRQGFAVLAYDYPGYGQSSGTPSEPGAYAAADAAYDHATRALHVPPERLIVHGRSLGGAVAIDLASRRPVIGLIVESTLTSASRVMFGFRPFVFERFNSIAKVDRLNCLALVMHGESDRVIAVWNGKRLFDRIPTPKHSLWVPGAGHNDLLAVAGPRYWSAIHAFVAVLPTAVPPRESPPGELR